LRGDAVPEPARLALVAPVIVPAATEPVRVGEAMPIGVGQKGGPRFEKKNLARAILAQSTGKDAAADPAPRMTTS
jgi:hypothetical protein